MDRKLGLLVSALLLIFISGFAQAQLPVPKWGRFGIMVNDVQGNTVQQNPQALKIGNEYFVVFEDARAGSKDLYFQKLDASGKLLLGKDGLPLSKASGDQDYPQLIKTQSEQVIIVWQDNRNGQFDIYAQKIDKAGNALWPEGGIPVCSFAQNQVFPAIASDGGEGAIITWHDYRSGAEDIYAQWVGADGNLYWKEEGVAVCAEPGTQWYPRIISDGYGGAVITWVDRRSGNFDIYAQKLDRKGSKVWGEKGVEVCAYSGNQDKPAIISDGDGGAILSWSDLRPDRPGIYLQKVKKDGNTAFNKNGVLAGVDGTQPGAPAMAADRYGGAVVVWSDPHAGDPDLYVQHMDAAGRMLWGQVGIPLVKIRGAQENPRIEGQGPWAIAWEDMRAGRKHIYVQRLETTGAYSLGYGGAVVSRQAIDPESCNLIFDGNTIFVAFADKRRGNFDIFAQAIGEKGELLFDPDCVMVNGTPGSVVQQNVKAIRDEQGNYLFAFEDYRIGYANIYLQKVSPAGKLLWDEAGIPASTGYFNQKNPDLVSDGAGGAIVVWEDEREATGPRIYAQRINFSGQALFDNCGLRLTPRVAVGKQSKPKLAPDGKGGAVAVFVDFRGTYNYQDIMAQRFDAGGKLLWGGAGTIVCSGNGNQDDPQIAPKSLVVCWTDHRLGERNSDIYAQKLELSGKTLWAEDGVEVCEAPDSQLKPQIVDNGENGVMVVWTDRGGGGYDIYAQRLDANGRPVWIKDGIPICQSARTQQNARVCLIDPANILVTWEDFKYGNWDIYAQKVNDNGSLAFEEGGVPICRVCGTQYSPFPLCVQGKCVIAWEDYRNGETYHIYLQALDRNGERSWGPEGILVEGSRAGGRAPTLLSGKGNDFVVVWEDYRLGGRGIYAQRFIF